MRHVVVAHLLRHGVHPHGGVGQKHLGPVDAHAAKQVKKALPRVAVDELGQMPLADVHMIGHVSQADMGMAMAAHVFQRGVDDEAARLAAPGGIVLRAFPLGGQRVQTGGHEAHSLVDFIHFTGLEQVPAHPQGQGLLGIIKVAVGGQHGHLHPRKFAVQRGQHGQAVHLGHADIGQHHVGALMPDEGQALPAVAGRAHHLTAQACPRHHTGQPLQNQPLIVHQGHAIHGIGLLPPLSCQRDGAA